MPPRKRKEGAGPVRLLSAGEVAAAVGLAPQSAQTARKRGKFPPPDFQVGPGGAGTVYAWLPERAQEGGEARRQRQERQELRDSKRARPCPVCGAAAGKGCISATGKRATVQHLVRWRAPGTH
jgi:hypothetical protein